MEFVPFETVAYPALLVPEKPSPETSVGITSTVPIEIIFASGHIPVDLNNIFITDEDPTHLVERAETSGLPRNNCAWIKGIYSSVKKLGMKKVIGVAEGDCSNTFALMEVLASEGVEVIPFKYPHGRQVGAQDFEPLQESLNTLASTLGGHEKTINEAERVKKELDRIRSLVHEIDRLTWQEGKVRGEENHIWNVSTSDMMGNPSLFEKKARAFLEGVRERRPLPGGIKIGFIGVPPICGGLYGFLEELGVRVVFNEIQRQFSMPYPTSTLLEQYLLYTYPYGIQGRVEDVRHEIKRRGIQGLIHYVQSFCYRNMYDTIFRRALGVPILTLECDRPGGIDGQLRTRIEAFVEMLRKKTI
ncbi:MAG: 2-hydroxyacyl-CoA dehydratase family protein [Candidatus Brocadiaceae bacterium]|nr:2-hydroxyacyl-CoA dehydratase family protein [Candidatus Brocadiaceae bacterium]